MREHKYQVWHKKEKKMYSPLCVYFSPEGRLFGVVIEEGQLLSIDDFELREYTGFKDFNGKDIYEGDRVSYLLRSGIVVWTDEAIPATGFVVKTRDGEVLPLSESWSVIGNIFED